MRHQGRWLLTSPKQQNTRRLTGKCHLQRTRQLGRDSQPPTSPTWGWPTWLEQGAPELHHVFGKNKHGDLKSTVASPTHENRIAEEPNVIPRTTSPYKNEWQKVAFLLHLQQAYCFFLGKMWRNQRKKIHANQALIQLEYKPPPFPSTSLMQTLTKTQINTQHFNISIMQSSA